jgi:8-oxo-dGTP diphosphatase
MTSPVVQVAVAVIVNQDSEVLISLRPNASHQGGLWEFPGGKLEIGESIEDALKRELLEELDICLLESQPFKIIQHQYLDKAVVLNIHIVSSFSGEPKGVEGQPIQWKSIDQLKPVDFPAANRSVVHSLQLPDKYMITGAFNDQNDFLLRLENGLRSGIKLVQMRCKNIDQLSFMELSDKARTVCEKYKATLLLNSNPEFFQQTQAHGLHLNSQILHLSEVRPIGLEKLLSVSCHTVADIRQAEKINADIVLLSPVKETTSHPGVKGLGWLAFEDLISDIDIPVYALGGMKQSDIPKAVKLGAQGVAAISSFWEETINI